MGQRRHVAHGPAAREGRPGRVLGLLPRQLAAHAALPEGVARALRGRRPADRRRAHRRLPAGARAGGNVRRAVERLEIPWPVRDRLRPRGLGHLRQPGLAGALPVGPGAASCTRCTTARAPTWRPSSRSRRCWASRATPLAPVRPEDAPDALIAPQTEDQPGAYSGPYEAGGVWAVVEGSGRRARQRRACWRSPSRAASRWSSTARHTRGELALEAGAGVTRPRHLLHAGRGLSSSCPRSPSRRTSRGGPSSSTITAVPGQ